MDLSDWRNKIDEIDADILKLLEQRAEIVSKIGKLKIERNLPVFDENRERQVFNRIILKANSNLSLESAISIFRCIVKESRRMQTKVRSYQKVSNSR